MKLNTKKYRKSIKASAPATVACEPSPVFQAAHRAWLAAEDLRRRRARYKRYTYGDQWSDMVTTPNGEVMTEGEYARQSGKRPLTNNLIRQLVKSIVGYFRTNHESSASTAAFSDDSLAADSQLSRMRQANHLDELDARMLEEFLISGCAIQRVTRESRPGKGRGVWVDNVSPVRFFINSTGDTRNWDTHLLGMIHDMSLTEVMMRYSHGSRPRARQLAEVFGRCTPQALEACVDRLGEADDDAINFLQAPAGLCRVIEVWTLESREILRCHDPHNGKYYAVDVAQESAIGRINRQRGRSRLPLINTRWEIDTRWHCRFFAPDGEVIEEMDSPYEHASHPFVVKLYPLTDGEIHSFVEDVIDQQRYVNRLISLIDHVMGASAKGVLLFPEDAKVDWQSWEDISKNWARPDGVIPLRRYVPYTTPQQLAANNTNIGAYQLLDLEMRLMEDISGVSRAFLGRDTGVATAASLYNAQAQNTAVALADIYATFNAFRRDRDVKMRDSLPSDTVSATA